jgi:hypothetical protein
MIKKASPGFGNWPVTYANIVGGTGIEPEDHEAVAVSCHHDTPGQHKRLRTTRETEVK